MSRTTRLQTRSTHEEESDRQSAHPFALGLSVIACDDDPVAGDDEEFAATLGPEGTVQTDATGSSTFVLDDGVVSYTIDVDDITAVTDNNPAGEIRGRITVQ